MRDKVRKVHVKGKDIILAVREGLILEINKLSNYSRTSNCVKVEKLSRETSSDRFLLCVPECLLIQSEKAIFQRMLKYPGLGSQGRIQTEKVGVGWSG